MDTHHISVLCDKVIDFLSPKPEGIYIDGTVGLGGHSTAILETSAPNGRVIGIDLDVEALTIAKSRLHVFGERYSLINGNFAEMDVLLERHSVHAVDGILLDLGVSSLQLDAPHRGFSFNHTGPLDMRMNARQVLNREREAALTAMQVVNDSPMDVLVDIFKRYGEERFAKRIAHRIIQTRRETLIDSYALRFQIEFNFRDAKQFWGLEDFMNVNKTPVNNAANLSMFMVNVSAKLLAPLRLEHSEFSVLDLKAHYRGLKYLRETLKILPQKPDTIVIDNLAEHLGAIGAIHYTSPQIRPG